MKKAKGIKGKADTEWSRKIRARDVICRLCKSRLTVNAHHIIDRRHKATRLLLKNGVGLCFMCHQFVEALSKVDWANPWENTNEYKKCMCILMHEDEYDELVRLSKKPVRYTDKYVEDIMASWGD
jgi:hypothetical protein